MKKNKVLSLLIAIIFCFSLIGCGSSSKNESGKNLEEVDLVLDWYPNAVHSFIYTAIEKGYFEEEGLKVNIKFPSNPTDPLSLPAAGKATVGIYYLQDLIMAKENQNLPVKSIGAVIQSPLNIVMSLKEANINSPKDLVGKTIGYSGNPLSEEVIKTMMKDSNVDPNAVNVIDVGFDLMPALTTKKVDATIGAMVNHEVPVMRNEGHDVNYFSPSNFGVPNYYELLFVANDNTIKNNPETLKKFLRASKKGFDFMKQHPDEALKILLAHQQADSFPLTESVEKQSMDVLLPVMEPENVTFLHQDEKTWQNNIDWLYDKGLIKTKPDAKDFFVNLSEQN